ncbi:MAG: hypothetical protein NTU90_05240, partial [Proteobacteria bacterium]|nr:hypothetical protein [Pseudomonadota bacterium]
FPAYLSCSFSSYSGYVAQCGSASSGTNYNYTKNYYGYFDTTKYYNYASSLFQVNSSCTYTNKIGGTNCISGNLLNWITSTRVDVARKVLTGGRTNTGTSDFFPSEGAVYTYTDSGLGCQFTITATTTKGRKLTISNKTSSTCAVGTLSASDIDIQPVDVSQAKGLVQDLYGKVEFEFMIFNTDNKGIIRSGKDGALSSLVAAIANELPYNGTPTGEALWEAYDFFKQSNDHSYASNSSAISAGDGSKDPWYDGSGASSTAIPCRKAYILLISDGAWNGSVDPVIPAKTMRISDLRSGLTGKQNVTTYPVYAFGDLDPDTKTRGRQAMITTALFGGFDDYDSTTWPYPFTAYPADSQEVTYPRSQCNPSGTWNDKCREWDKSKTGLPYNFFEADDGDVLETALYSALNDMIRRASSGTAASVLASSEGSGANLLQAVFYPKRIFGTTEIEWTGEMQDLWYYIDPFLQNSTIREDTDNNKILHLTNDYVIQFYFDSSVNETKVKRYSDTNGDGAADNLINIVDLEEVKNLWAAGTLLSQRNLSTSSRTIYTKLQKL